MDWRDGRVGVVKSRAFVRQYGRRGAEMRIGRIDGMAIANGVSKLKSKDVDNVVERRDNVTSRAAPCVQHGRVQRGRVRW